MDVLAIHVHAERVVLHVLNSRSPGSFAANREEPLEHVLVLHAVAQVAMGRSVHMRL